MPDEVKVEGEPKPGPTPALDADALKGMIESTVSDAFDRRAQEFQDQSREPAARPEPTTNPLAAAIEPIVGPGMRTVAIGAASAQDAALFYSNSDEKEARARAGHKKEVEEAFNRLIQQGTPFSREAVWAWYKGSHQDKFIQDAIKDHDAAMKAAQEAGTVGPSSTRLSDAPTATNPHTMKDEDLDKALQGVNF